MKHLSLTSALVLASFVSACATTTPQSTSPENSSVVSAQDRAEIEARVYDYFDGQGFADAERLDRAFADNATMHGVMTADDETQTLRQWPDFQNTLKGWGENDTPPGERDGEITSLSVVDGRIATVQFRSADRFFDALTLVKVNGEWVIATKVFVRQ